MSEPERLSDLLKQFRKKSGLRHSKRLAKIRTYWIELVGEDLARTTRVAYLRQGTLKVEVESSVLLQELSTFQKEELLQALQEKFPEVKDLRFSLGAF